MMSHRPKGPGSRAKQLRNAITPLLLILKFAQDPSHTLLLESDRSIEIAKHIGTSHLSFQGMNGLNSRSPSNLEI